MSKLADETIPPPPSRRSALDYYFNPSRASDRFWRLFSSREKVIENLKTLVWVIPITLVIWIYAEREQVIAPTGPNVSKVSVHIVTSDPKLYVEMWDSTDPNPTVDLKLTGPQQALERVKERLTSNIPRGLPTIDLGTLAVGKKQQVNILDHIQNMDLFKSNGVTVQDVQPPTISVNVDSLVHVTLPVQVPTTVNNLSPDSHFEPPNITVSGPESLLKSLAASGELKAYANLVGNADLKTEGQHTINSVPIVLSPQLPEGKLRIDPSQVKADFRVRAADVPYTIQNMPITVNAAPSTIHNFDLVLSGGESITITVTGPQEQIDAMKAKTVPFSAVLEVSQEDSSITASPSKKLTYFMPPGVKVSPADLNRTVEFKLTRRDNTGG
jgi:hypothetical protein